MKSISDRGLKFGQLMWLASRLPDEIKKKSLSRVDIGEIILTNCALPIFMVKLLFGHMVSLR